jgi:hypothetical protein
MANPCVTQKHMDVGFDMTREYKRGHQLPWIDIDCLSRFFRQIASCNPAATKE